ncbi:MAG: N-ethylmaleimide reductase [Candidatus Celerinatantimonas neptuna]|nr:MAG: N-ethylmaleimide reductase [Candidatus Celerinatantimonas neptuna]
MNHSLLLEPYSLNNSIHLTNRIVMAPMTRCMADEDLIPTKAMADYYTARADVGLIITEATIIRPDGQGYPNTPGIYNKKQIDGWNQVTSQVHQANGTIFCQIWHTGRIAHPSFFDPNGYPIAPSAIAAKGSVPRQRHLTYQTPHAVTLSEIKTLVEDYVKSAQNAIKAGFDGIEIHAANGYLIDQFLHFDSNQRIDEYGNSPENMIRFLLEITDAITEEIGGQRVGVRLSPLGYINSITPVSRDREVFDLLLMELDKRKLAYIHGGLFDDSMQDSIFDGNINDYLKAHTCHPYIGVGGLTPITASQGISKGRFDLAAIGRPLIANPDYIECLETHKDLKSYNEQMLSTLI